MASPLAERRPLLLSHAIHFRDREPQNCSQQRWKHDGGCCSLVEELRLSSLAPSDNDAEARTQESRACTNAAPLADLTQNDPLGYLTEMTHKVHRHQRLMLDTSR